MFTTQRFLLAATAVATVLLTPATGVAQHVGWQGTRALGLGGALRSAATGDSGPTLNPSGIALIRSYNVEAGYQLDAGPSPELAHRAHAAIVDSTSSSGLGGGVYYSYLSSTIVQGKTTHGHEGGVSLAFPFGDRFTIGSTLKYLRISNATEVAPNPKVENTSAGFTFDAGATIRPVNLVAVGLVGYNLVDSGTPLAPRAFGWGASLAPDPSLLIAFDGVVDVSSKRLLGSKDEAALSLMAGAEYVMPTSIAVRAGGGRDGLRENGFLTAGASAVSEVGAIDIALLRDIAGSGKQTIFAISARLFVPDM